MGRPKGSTSDARERLMAAAGKGFRSGGFGGIGVDGLAKAAGLTSGAFYAHFGSKAEAFRQAARQGIDDLAKGIAAFREGGAGWPQRFIDFYLTERVTCDIGEACALQSLTVDVARADAPTRGDFAQGLEASIAALAPGTGDRASAIALLALLSGGVSMARAVDDPVLAAEILAALRAQAEAIAAA